jgi:hypothetical protein
VLLATDDLQHLGREGPVGEFQSPHRMLQKACCAAKYAGALVVSEFDPDGLVVEWSENGL